MLTEIAQEPFVSNLVLTFAFDQSEGTLKGLYIQGKRTRKRLVLNKFIAACYIDKQYMGKKNAFTLAFDHVNES